MYKVLLLFVFILCTKEGIAKIAPDYINICPGLKSDCLKKTIQETIPEFSKGIPSLGVESLDPLVLNLIKLELPGGLQVQFSGGRVTGLRKCVVDSVNYVNDEAEMDFHCNITLKGKYKAAGKLLIVAINGNGDAKIKIINTMLSTKIKFQDVTRDGVLYSEIKDMKVKHQFGGRVTFQLTNLFEGNPQISEAVLTFLNENWKQVADEFGKPAVDKTVEVVGNIIKQFFKAVPKNELFVF